MNFLSKEGLSLLWANIIAKLDNKVDKLTGKQLSTNDFTDEEKNKIATNTSSISQLETNLDNKASQTIIRIW